jgi:hypothetical protein
MTIVRVQLQLISKVQILLECPKLEDKSLIFLVTSKKCRRFFQNFVAFSEYLNFTYGVAELLAKQNGRRYLHATSQSAYVATKTESDGAKIDGSF